MTQISHHIDDLMLIDYHNGRLREGQALIVSAHLQMCGHCRTELRLCEEVGAAVFDATMPVDMRPDALELALARIERPEAEISSRASVPVLPKYLQGIDLPEIVRNATWKKRYWAAPGVWMAHIDDGKTGSKADRSLTYLMCVKAGMAMPEHDHQGYEMTMVLTGAFSDRKGQYVPGDCLVCEEGEAHSPIIAMDQDCLCLISALAPIQPTTLLGKLLQPFARI